MHRSNTWAVVLAGGDGSRLSRLTRNRDGVSVPKQFCSLKGGPSLLQASLKRAAAVAPLHQICTVVAEQHRKWWAPILSYLPERNVIVQPQNRGTAYGVLLPLLHIIERDPSATVVLLPADHYLSDESIMVKSLRRAAGLAEADRDSIFLLGVQPDEPDAELGYIVPASAPRDTAVPVASFVEKPSEMRARTLLAQGALWNAFIVAASARALLGLFGAQYTAAISGLRGYEGATIDSVYQNLTNRDFSGDVLQGNESLLKVLAVPHCGWTDLGTPKRVALTLQRMQEDDLEGGGAAANHPSLQLQVSLATQYARGYA